MSDPQPRPGRFEGAVTGPADGAPRDASLVPAPVRGRRPPLIELAAAILIVGGTTSLLGVLGTLDPATELLDLVFIGLALATIVVGLLVRAGRAWLLDINLAAIILFLELTALPSGVAIVFAALDAIVLVALFRHRSWFDPPAAMAEVPEPAAPAGSVGAGGAPEVDR